MMRWSEFRKRFGCADNHAALNKAIRDDVPGGHQLIDAADALHREIMRPRAGRTATELADMQWLLDSLLQNLTTMRERIAARYGVGSFGRFDPRPAEGDAIQPEKLPVALVSIHASAEPATPELSLGLLSSSSPNGGKDWTPLAGERVRKYAWTPELVAMLGKNTDRAVADAAGDGRDAESVRRYREAHGIRARKSINRWTPDEDNVIMRVPPAEAAEMLNRPLNAVKIRRSRLQKKYSHG